MELTINNKIFICFNTQLPVRKYIDNHQSKFKIGLYYNAIDKTSNKKCIIYNRRKLNEYRISQLTGTDKYKVDIVKCIDLHKKDGYFKLPKKYLHSIGVDIEVKYDIDVIYNSNILKNIPFLPNILEINDDYVVYEIEDGYVIPVIGDMIDKIEILKNIIKNKNYTSYNGNNLYNKIVQDVVCFNYDSGRYIRNQQPFFECLKGMSIEYLSIGRHIRGYDSSILINKKTNNWLYISMHDLLPNLASNSSDTIDSTISKSDMYNKLNLDYSKIYLENNKKLLSNIGMYIEFA